MQRLIIAICFSLILSEGISQSVKVIRKTDYTQFETFTVAKGELTVSGEDQKISDEQFYEKVKTFVRQELELKGYKFVEGPEADFTVDYVAGSFSITENEDLGPLGGRPATDPTMTDQSRYWSNYSQRGLLVLEIYRGKPDNILWTAESTIDFGTINLDRAIATGIAKSFKKFPSKLKGRQRIK